MPAVPLTRAADASSATPGQWWASPDRKWVSVTCGACGKGASIVRPFGRSHVVDAQGKVTPSLVCPHEGCVWHVFVHLVGW